VGLGVMQLSRTDFFCGCGCGCGCDAIDATQSAHVSLWLVSSSVTAGYHSSFSFLPEYPTPFLLVLVLVLLYFCFLFFRTYHLSWVPAAQQQERLGFPKFLWV
jgi:hypothetical protein